MDTLVSITDQEEILQGSLVKSLSLVLRLYQHSLDNSSIKIIYDFLF